jgi:hypothetical protein
VANQAANQQGKTMNRHPSGILVAALALSLLTGCGAAKDTNGSSASSGDAKSGSNQGAASNEGSNGSGEMGVDMPDLSKTIYSKQFTIPGKPQGKVTVGILSLERKDRLAILKVVVTPEFGDLPASELISFTKALDESSTWAPTLLDLTNLKKYRVVGGTGGYLNFEDGKAVSGQPIYGWAAFAAPPASVKNLDLIMTEWMPRFTNVPIQ